MLSQWPWHMFLLSLKVPQLAVFMNSDLTFRKLTQTCLSFPDLWLYILHFPLLIPRHTVTSYFSCTFSSLPPTLHLELLEIGSFFDFWLSQTEQWSAVNTEKYLNECLLLDSGCLSHHPELKAVSFTDCFPRADLAAWTFSVCSPPFTPSCPLGYSHYGSLFTAVIVKHVIWAKWFPGLFSSSSDYSLILGVKN